MLLRAATGHDQLEYMQNDLFRQGIDWTLAHMLRFSSLIYEVEDCVVCQAKGCQPAVC
jgi:hypothetical protein